MVSTATFAIGHTVAGMVSVLGINRLLRNMDAEDEMTPLRLRIIRFPPLPLLMRQGATWRCLAA